jgi:ankyrin repeat protein
MLLKYLTIFRFRWAELQMKALEACRTANSVRDTLKSLPTTLHATYNRMLEKISKSDNKEDLRHVKNALMWLAFAKRPMTLEELAEAAILPCPVPTTVDPDSRFFDIMDVLRICGGLVSLIPFKGNYDWHGAHGSIAVKLSHYSVKEYLVSVANEPCPSPWIREPKRSAFGDVMRNSTKILAETCITYLLQDDISAEVEFDDLVKSFPLTGYAAYYWHQHFIQADAATSNHLERATMRLMEDQYPLLRSCTWNLSPNPLFGISPGPSESRLFYASYYGLDTIVRKMLKAGRNSAIQRQETEEFMLVYAALNGHSGTVEVLLKDGADVNMVDGFLGSALGAAAYRGHGNVVSLLRKWGASLDWANSTSGQTVMFQNALEAAAAGGHWSLVRRFLDEGLDINIGGSYCGPLGAAASLGHEPLVEQLLQARADINHVHNGYTALAKVNSHSSPSMVHLLLDHGADFNAGDCAATVLSNALFSGDEILVRRLLREGIEIHGTNRWGEKALRASLCGPSTSVAHLLLDEGFVIPMGNDPDNGLPDAAAHGDEALVIRLLEAGADINTIHFRTGTALTGAAGSGHESIVRLLLEKGADVNVLAGTYGTALAAAATSRSDTYCLVIVQLLLAHGAEINLTDGESGTALMWAAIGGEERESVVRLLLESGADVNLAAGRWGTPLAAAACWGYESVIRLLLSHNADPNIRAGKNGLPLQAAVSEQGHQPRLGIVYLLLDHGADVNAVSGPQNRTALAAALYNGHHAVARLLRERGAVSPPDVDGDMAMGGTTEPRPSSTNDFATITEVSGRVESEMIHPSYISGISSWIFIGFTFCLISMCLCFLSSS